MVENHQDIIREKIETHLEYFLSTSDDAQKQIQYLLSADLGGGNSTYLLDILVGVCKPPLAYLDRMNSHGKSLLRPLLDVFFSFENIMRLANDESIKESEMFEVLLSKMSYYYLRHDLREETPNIRFDPWPWLDYLLNDSDKEAELILSFDGQSKDSKANERASCNIPRCTLRCAADNVEEDETYLPESHLTMHSI